MNIKKKTQKQKHTGETLPMRAIYDALMANVEPELTSAEIRKLAAKYKNETAKERRARGDRYAKAFEIFWQRFSTVAAEWKRRLLAFKDDAMASAEREAGVQDAEALRTIDTQLGTL